jgi:molybdopterin converting factor small subunit
MVVMQVTVKYFGLAASRIGKREEAITLPTGSSLAELKGLLEKEYRLGSETFVFYNVNGKGVAKSDMECCQLTENDVIMIIPQISGG